MEVTSKGALDKVASSQIPENAGLALAGSVVQAPMHPLRAGSAPAAAGSGPAAAGSAPVPRSERAAGWAPAAGSARPVGSVPPAA